MIFINVGMGSQKSQKYQEDQISLVSKKYCTPHLYGNPGPKTNKDTNDDAKFITIKRSLLHLPEASDYIHTSPGHIFRPQPSSFGGIMSGVRTAGRSG